MSGEKERQAVGAAWQLRAARPEDAGACAALAVAAWQRVHDAFVEILGAELHDRVCAQWQQAKAEAVATAIRDRPDHALVATIGDLIVGFVTFSLDQRRHIGEIGNNAVDPAWQGHGIATGLYQATLAHMRSAGMRAARVTTGLDEGHAPARAAYQKVGFALELPSVTYYQNL